VSVLSIIFAINNIDSDVVIALLGFIFIFCAVMNTFGIRVYGLDWREWRYNYKLSRELSMVTRVGLFFLGLVLIGLAMYNGLNGR
jgi:hypothetical protein